MKLDIKNKWPVMMVILSGISLGLPIITQAGDAQLKKQPVECRDRPKGIHAPPKRLAPMAKAKKGHEGDHDEDEDKDDKESHRHTHLGLKPLCPESQAIHVIAKTPISKKGNPLIGPDRDKVYRTLKPEQQAEFIARHVRTFKEVYLDKQPPSPSDRNTPPPPPEGCDGIYQFGSCYYYANAAFSTNADGGGMTQSIEKPQYVNTGGSGHTLDELAVQGGAGNGNIVELGWLVSTDQYNGNANPHLFVFHWKNWAPTCYDGCGWVQWSNTYYPGMDLGNLVKKNVYIGYVFYQGNWWAWFDNQWLGYFPGSEWGGDYIKSNLIQWFGEVSSANGIPPQTDMGDGQHAGATMSASMNTLCDVDAKAWVCWYRNQQSIGDTVPKYYDINNPSFGSVHYGGSGQ